MCYNASIYMVDTKTRKIVIESMVENSKRMKKTVATIFVQCRSYLIGWVAAEIRKKMEMKLVHLQYNKKQLLQTTM